MCIYVYLESTGTTTATNDIVFDQDIKKKERKKRKKEKEKEKEKDVVSGWVGKEYKYFLK